MGTITLNRLDLTRIQTCLKEAMQVNAIRKMEAATRIKEIQSASVVDPESIPSNVVTMNSIVQISFLNTKKTVEFQIVYPNQANVKENKISIFSPIATALIGYKAGDEIDWVVPAGITKIKIDAIVYQPEAAGHYNV